MRRISDAELEIMKIVWAKDGATSNEIINELKEKQDWNPNTVKTLITRLLNKGAMEGIRYNGKSYIYKPLIGENEYAKKATINFVEKLYNGSVNNMLLNFVKEEKISKAELQYLIDLIEDEEK